MPDTQSTPTLWRTALIDDELHSRNRLRSLLSNRPDIEIVGEADSVSTAITMCGAMKPELIFLDIEMPDGSGFDVLPHLKTVSHVVFVTAYSDYAARAFDVNAVDYLTKPVFPDRLSKALDRLTTPERGLFSPPPIGTLSDDDSVFLQDGKSFRMVRVTSIVSIRAEGNYTVVSVQGSNDFWMLRPMHEWEQSLPSRIFFRVDRSLMINLQQISGLEVHSRYSAILEMTGKPEKFELGRTALSRLRTTLESPPGK
ncbi:MAG: LytR/AlgR family response regulator transcription factor [Verrucomicrobium sp.]